MHRLWPKDSTLFHLQLPFCGVQIVQAWEAQSRTIGNCPVKGHFGNPADCPRTRTCPPSPPQMLLLELHPQRPGNPSSHLKLCLSCWALRATPSKIACPQSASSSSGSRAGRPAT